MARSRPGGRRHTQARSAKQVSRRQDRMADERVTSALDEVRRERERLERRIAREKTQPAIGRVLGADYGKPALTAPQTAPEPAPKPVVKPVKPAVKPVVISPDAPALKRRFPDLPWDLNGDHGAIGQARAMLREGYHIRKVVQFYGVGLKWLDDIPLDEMGFGLPHAS